MSRAPDWAYVDVDKLVSASMVDLRLKLRVHPSGSYKAIYLVMNLAPRALVRRGASEATTTGAHTLRHGGGRPQGPE